MLTILAFINSREIGRVQIHNLGIVNSKGEHKYEVMCDDPLAVGQRWRSRHQQVIVWHKQEDGWMKLTEKVLRKLRKSK